MGNSDSIVRTPLMEQYFKIKSKHPDAILLFRVGDFYETFSDDAIKTSEILNITLTRRANGAAQYIELAGFPYHALDTYLPKLVRAGQRVAICEQLEDPKLTKKIVKRGVTELVTPGVALNDNVLNVKENNFLACVHLENNISGIAFLDISTGEFYLSEGSIEYIDKLIQSFQPKEVLYERSKLKIFVEYFGPKLYKYHLEDWIFKEDTANERLLKHFQTNSLKGFGISNLRQGIIAAGAILHYLDITQHSNLNHISKISRIDEQKYVWLDKFTIRNLELFNPISEGGSCLINVIDKTISPMGSRCLKRWLMLPLKDINEIEKRLNSIDYFINNDDSKNEIEKNIKLIGDLERLISKVAVQRINPREIVQLKNALKASEPIKEICISSNNDSVKLLGEKIINLENLIIYIEKHLNDEAPIQVNKGNVIKKGINNELDTLRELQTNGKDYILKIQEREIENTNIPSLKINFNNVFGYYIEVRNTHKDKVPENWIRKQTLVSAERYITEELKEYESKILGAEEKIIEIESKIFEEVISRISEFINPIQINASTIAEIDSLISLSNIAIENKYIRPSINNSDILNIKNGRHPVIEKLLSSGESYIPNDIELDCENQQIIMITGPNMSGKSALLRQTALIVILAQIGSFVPAEKVDIGIVDKIFTRVGASDNISQGESTFMVEMNEAASIINNFTNKSLILLDEIGRGTSTYDGISIAWAIAEYIHEHPKNKAKTMFATHYHELNEMEKTFNRIKNYNVSVKEIDKKIIFLRKLVRGGSEHSFGIHVAKMAGMPKSLINRAEEILFELENSHNKEGISKPIEEIIANKEGYQLSFFQLDDPVLSQIRDNIKTLDINNLTPVQALNILSEIKALLKK